MRRCCSAPLQCAAATRCCNAPLHCTAWPRGAQEEYNKSAWEEIIGRVEEVGVDGFEARPRICPQGAIPKPCGATRKRTF